MVLSTCLRLLSNVFFNENPTSAGATGEPMATLMVVSAVGSTVGEAEETWKVAWEGGGDVEKQSLD